MGPISVDRHTRVRRVRVPRPWFGGCLLWAAALLAVGGSLAKADDTVPREPPGPPEAATIAAMGAAAMVRSLATSEKQEHPWGWIRWLVNSDIDPDSRMTLGIVHIKAGQSNPLHIHATCDELIYVLSGSCEHRIGDKTVTLKAGDMLRIPAGTAHAARTSEDEPMEAIVVYDVGRRDFQVIEE